MPYRASVGKRQELEGTAQFPDPAGTPKELQLHPHSGHQLSSEFQSRKPPWYLTLHQGKKIFGHLPFQSPHFLEFLAVGWHPPCRNHTPRTPAAELGRTRCLSFSRRRVRPPRAGEQAQRQPRPSLRDGNVDGWGREGGEGNGEWSWGS